MESNEFAPEEKTMDKQLIETTLANAESHWWYVGRAQTILSVVRALPMGHSPEILDVGTGSGAMLELLSEVGTALGIETDRQSYEFARRRNRRVQLVDGSSIPFADKHFQLVTSFDVIEHVDNASALLAEMRRVTSRGGWGVFTVPASPRLWSNHDVTNGHYRRYTRDLLTDHLEEANWQIVDMFHFNWILYPLAASVRLAERVRRSGSPENQVDSSSSIGGLGTFAFSTEDRLRRLRIRAPFGLSLLAVVRNVYD